MRTFDSRHYSIVGYGEISTPEGVSYQWILETKNVNNDQNFQPMRILVECAKYVDHGRLSYLGEDGHVYDVNQNTLTAYL